MTPFTWNRLSTKLILANLLYSLALVAIVGALVFLGFRQTQRNATSRSVEALTDQGRDALRLSTEQEASFAQRQLLQAASLGRVAADYLLSFDRTLLPDPPILATAPGGQRYDDAPDRLTETWIGAGTPFSAALERDVRLSAAFDPLFPALVVDSPDAIAIYYMTPAGLGRYYPVVDLVDRLPDDFSFAEQPFYSLATPAANPAGATVWSPPYQDFVGLGPIVTASTPLYEGETFRGVIGVDISLTRLIQRLNALSPSPGGYAFLVDAGGRFVAASPRALEDLLGKSFAGDQQITITETLGIPLAQSDNPQVLAALAEMQRAESGLVELELRDRPVLLAHAPLPAIGWHLGLVAPVDEIAARSAAVAEAIQEDAADTLQSTTAALLAAFLVALLIVALLSRRLIVRRVEALLAGTQAIAARDLDVRIPVESEDELGRLAASFNDMAAQLTAARDELEERVASRTRELAALFDVTAVASSSLDLEQVMNRSLARVVEVMKARNGSIHMLDSDRDVLTLAAARNVLPAVRAEIEEVAVGEAVVGQVAREDGPLYVPVIAADTRAVPAAGDALGRNSYLGAPMRAKGETIGVLSVVGRASQTFTSEEISLLATIADQVGVAVENARLYRQAEDLAVVQERQRLARELHDAVTQSVYSATLLAATGQRAAAAGRWEDVNRLLERLENISGQALKELRLLVYELRPSALENAGLVEALQQRLDAVEGRAGIDARLLVEGDGWLSEAQEAALYRVAVEALNNSLKHAGATAVTLRLAVEAERVTLTIEDNGGGFDPAAAAESGGLGLQSMRERVQQFDGTLTIDSEPGQGTRLRATLPRASTGP